MAGEIVKLPDWVANQIAAGEVVERPVAVVKELVENALDARAGSIEIQFERGGKALIRVLDDGSGMTRENAAMALERHATSKIRSVEDILRIGSFGFRGEALPSIASVSRFTLKTRVREAPGGIEIRVRGKGAPDISECGMSPGTEVTVANLFHNIPARRKFLKTERTESAHILQMCRLLAVAHPEVAFSLIEHGHEVFRTPACPDRLQRVREIFGKRRAEDLIEVEAGKEGLRLSGLIGRPGSGRSTRAEMVTYVNKRPVESRLLSYALIESYHRYLPRGRYPMAFLFIEVDPEEVDVNVHPAKREVRFRNEPAIRSGVMTGLTERLAEASRQTLRRAEPVEGAHVPEERSSPETERETEPETERGKKKVAPETVKPSGDPPKPVLTPSVAPARREFPRFTERPFAPVEAETVPRPRRSGVWRYCGVLRQRLGLFESPDGLIILNARAARERILFERIEASLAGQEIPRQPLLIPPMLELAPLDAGVLSDQRPFFESIGFGIEPFGRHLFRIRTVPAWLQAENPERFVEDLVNRIRERGLMPQEEQPARSLVARLAASREARGYVPDSQPSWEALAEALLACENPLLDARGKPTFVEQRHGEIARKLMLEGLPEASDRLDGGA